MMYFTQTRTGALGSIKDRPRVGLFLVVGPRVFHALKAPDFVTGQIIYVNGSATTYQQSPQ